MNTDPKTYEQFIYGKLANQMSDYQIVAHTPDLIEKKDSLEKFASKYRFWGNMNPDPENQAKAVGCFLEDPNLILVQATPGSIDYQGRPYYQYRYIFIPIKELDVWQYRTFPLVDWLLKQSAIPAIPIFSQYKADLAPMSIPWEQLMSNPTQEEKINTIQRCLSDVDTKGKSLLALSLAALLNNQRLLLNYIDSPIKSQNYIETILLLLPTAVRHTIPLAIGTIEEPYCTWAKLLFKNTDNDGIQDHRFPQDLVWLDRKSKNFIGNCDYSKLEAKYVSDIILPIAKHPDGLLQLLERLNKITDTAIELENITDPEIIIPLIPALPEEEQDKLWDEYLSAVNADKWNAIIQLLVEDSEAQKGREVAWQKLGNATKNPNSEQHAALMLDFLDRVSGTERSQRLSDLERDPVLTEILVDRGLLKASYLDPELLSKMHKLCQKVVEHKSKSNWSEVPKFARLALDSGIFHEYSDRFDLLDAALCAQITEEQLYLFLNSEFTDLLAYVKNEQFTESNLFKKLEEVAPEAAKLLRKLFNKQDVNLTILARLAELTKMEDSEQDNLYSSFLDSRNLSYEYVRELLIEILKPRLSVDKEFKRNTLAKTYEWFEKKESSIVDIFDNLEKNTKDWHTWEDLAKVLYHEQQEQDCIKFLDSKVGSHFRNKVLEQWLPIAKDSDIRKTFITSQAWEDLLSNDLSKGKIAHSFRKYAETIVICLGDSNNLECIKGDLLSYLGENWMSRQSIDLDVKMLVSNPNVTKNYTKDDWCNLAKIAWTPGIDLELPPITSLKQDEKADLVPYAKEKVRKYTKPEQTQRLLSDCETWRLDSSQLKEIVKVAPAIDIDLLLKYLVSDVNAIQPDRDFPLIFKEFKRLSTGKISELLENSLIPNLPLAEKLLEDGLLDQSYIIDRDDIFHKLREISRKVVNNKSQLDWTEGTKFAEKLAHSKIFQDPSDRFWLLDASLEDEISENQLYDFFNTRFVPLLAEVKGEIGKSNLYQQLQAKSSQAAQVLENLLNQQIIQPKYLVELVKLTGMQVTEQDKLYSSFLVIRKFSYEDGQNLLIEYFRYIRSQEEVLNVGSLSKTCEWFQNKNPELGKILRDLDVQNFPWSLWTKMANILYDKIICHEQKKKTTYLLDKILPKKEHLYRKLLQWWMSIMDEDRDEMKKFIETSYAWPFLLEQLDKDELDINLEKYIKTITICLIESGKHKLLRGNLLGYLCKEWKNHKPIDPDLKKAVTAPSVTQGFTIEDWLQLQLIAWEPGIELELPLEKRPSLDEDHKKYLVCKAKQIVNTYTSPTETQRLLDDCQVWGLDITQRKSIICEANAYSIDLICKYLYNNGNSNNPSEEIDWKLVELLLQVQPKYSAEEKKKLKFYLSRICELMLPPQINPNVLEWMEEKAADKELFKEVFQKEIQPVAGEWPLKQLESNSQKIPEVLFSPFMNAVCKMIPEKMREWIKKHG